MQDHNIGPPAIAAAPLIDIGINLAHDSYDADRDAVIDARRGRRRHADDGHRLDARKLGARHRAGTHANQVCSPPRASIRTTRASSVPSALAELRQLAQAPEVVAVGECGLDYFRDLSPRAAQQQAVPPPARAGAHPSASRYSCTSAMRTRTSSAILREHAGELGAASRTASPVPRTSSAPTWNSDLRSASPAGSAMSAAARTCCRSCRRFRRSDCCWRPMAPTCCRATCSPSPPRGAMSRRIFRTSRPRWRAPAAESLDGAGALEHGGSATAVCAAWVDP